MTAEQHPEAVWLTQDDEPGPPQQQRAADPHRHPGGRTCATSAGIIAAIGAMLVALGRRAGR